MTWFGWLFAALLGHGFAWLLASRYYRKRERDRVAIWKAVGEVQRKANDDEWEELYDLCSNERDSWRAAYFRACDSEGRAYHERNVAQVMHEELLRLTSKAVLDFAWASSQKQIEVDKAKVRIEELESQLKSAGTEVHYVEVRPVEGAEARNAKRRAKA